MCICSLFFHRKKLGPLSNEANPKYLFLNSQGSCSEFALRSPLGLGVPGSLHLSRCAVVGLFRRREDSLAAAAHRAFSHCPNFSWEKQRKQNSVSESLIIWKFFYQDSPAAYTWLCKAGGTEEMWPPKVKNHDSEICWQPVGLRASRGQGQGPLQSCIPGLLAGDKWTMRKSGYTHCQLCGTCSLDFQHQEQELPWLS